MGKYKKGIKKEIMRNKKTNSRLENLIESDRLTLSNEVSELICYDLKKLLENYFTNTSNVSISVEGKDTCYSINITASSSSIKSFKILK